MLSPQVISDRPPAFPWFLQNSEDVIEVIGADNGMSTMHSVFLGFIHNPAVNDHSNGSSSDSPMGSGSFNPPPFNTFTREDYCLDKALAECNSIKARNGFQDGILLKCIDAKPMFTYLHYSIFDAGSAGKINGLIRDLDPSPKSQYGAYEELSDSPMGSGSFNPPPFNTFTREDYCLDKALAECNSIKARNGFQDGILLKCIDAKPMFTYLHYSIFDAGSAGKINGLIRDLDPSPKSQYGAYEELFAIQKSASSPETALPSNRHSGFIVSCFKLLDDNCKQHNLEKTWLSWSGAREIYKYAPRNWNLRKITLHRHSVLNGKTRMFAYVLMCEFGNILHPSNTIQALDMCERLRARNCGHIALYQVQFNYGQPFGYTQPSPMSHPAPTPGLGPWNSPGVSRTSPIPSRRMARNPMLRGYSQDVEASSETSRRRSALLRLRDHSLGYDLEEPPNSRFNYQNYDEMA
uniref:Uncharacterized protein n=1 Tax=Panagrolaimus sp. JU765 TaxID=591449 RepID=A0AC34R2K2_9BILA